MNPSPEIVELPRRPHIQPWGDTVATPLLHAFLTTAAIAMAVALATHPEGASSASSACFVVLGLIPAAAFVITLTNAINRRRQHMKDLDTLEAHGDRYADAVDDPIDRPIALLRLAQLAFLRGSRHGRWFDLALWDCATGDCSPRTIVAAFGLDFDRPVEAVAEEFDLISEPPAPLRSLIGEAGLWLILLVLAAIMVQRQAADPLTAAVIIGGAALIAVVHFCRRAAIRLIAIRSAIASPGRVEFGGFLGAMTFTVDDAMLFVVDRNQDAAGKDPLLEIILCRKDNTIRKLRVSGPGDPRLAEVIARWTAACAGARASTSA